MEPQEKPVLLRKVRLTYDSHALNGFDKSNDIEFSLDLVFSFFEQNMLFYTLNVLQFVKVAETETLYHVPDNMFDGVDESLP